MGKRNHPAQPPVAPEAPRNNPFAALGALRDTLPAGALPAPEPPAAATDRERAPARPVVRLERKGRAGKEVTRVEIEGASRDALHALLKRYQMTLGCGGTLEDGVIILQGDQRKRIGELSSS